MRHDDIPHEFNALTERIIACAIEVKREIAPGRRGPTFGSSPSMTHRFACPCAVLALCAGCTSYPIHAMQTDAELAARLSESFRSGMSYDEVNGTLSELRITERYRHTYSGAPPRDMLARVFKPGGFWLDRDIEHVRWVDLTFSFDEADSLDGLWTSRGGARYVDNWPITIVPSPFIGNRRYYPAPPPPPVTPPRENEVPLPGS